MTILAYFRVRQALAPFARLVSPGYSYCLCCRMPWSFVREHITNYADGAGCFPLCERCWVGMLPSQRIFYYLELWRSWTDNGDLNHATAQAGWEAIYDAVMAGG